MKVIAKTTGAFELYDPNNREVMQVQPRVVEWTQFYESRTGAGQIKVLASNLPEEATDAAFQKFLEEAESEPLAVAAYLSLFEDDTEEGEPEPEPTPEPETEPEPEKKPRGRKPAAKKSQE